VEEVGGPFEVARGVEDGRGVLSGSGAEGAGTEDDEGGGEGFGRRPARLIIPGTLVVEVEP
jgi:hypothetical protein